jgi:CheY-like chemotaxis protein
MLANLCVNARDAIANVGRITIETGNRVFDADYCASHVDCALGEFVRVAVSDNGCGIDREVLPQIFEPFFTTKGTGMGTGLGLSTVYGAVKQNGGFINVYSEVDQGTTFSIYLPRHEGVVEKGPLDGAQEALRRGHETILVVEDETAILSVTRTMLERQGYTVLAANSPAEAVRLAREHEGQIHLLVTDIVMPEMNGRELAKYLTTIYPQLRHLFMSGYTASVIAHHGVLDSGVPFIQKPFSMKELTAKVRETLD